MLPALLRTPCRSLGSKARQPGEKGALARVRERPGPPHARDRDVDVVELADPALEPGGRLREPDKVQRKTRCEGVHGVAQPLVRDAEPVHGLRVLEASGSPALDFSPGVVDHAPRELRQSLVARGLDPECEQRVQHGAAAVKLPRAHHAAQGRPQGSFATPAPANPGLDIRPLERQRTDELEQHLFVSERLADQRRWTSRSERRTSSA